MRLMSRRRYSMNAAKTSETSPSVTISGPGASAAGLPAITIPVYWTGGGPGQSLPMGIQLVGPAGSERLLLQVAAQLGF